MLESFLAQLDTILLVVFGVSALVGGVLVILLRQPMRVAMALISTMVFLGGIYGLLGVHFIAAFQVLIYVGAVMVFMVYVIMLLDVRDRSYTRRYSGLLVPGIAVLPHFDPGRATAWREVVDPAGRLAWLGLDERTLVIGRPGNTWTVAGAGRAHVIPPGAIAPMRSVGAGEVLALS